MNTLFDPAAEAARFAERQALLARQAALRLDLAPGITLQPETTESVEDQVRETLLAEGLDPARNPEDLAEARRSFAVLAPRRESGGHSLAATLFLGFPAEEREARLAALHRFPDGLLLELSDGSTVPPEVDRGGAGPEDRLPAVLALRWTLPQGRRPAAILSTSPPLRGRFPGPDAWERWY
ncbi:MAG: DUF3501 family protein [Acidobacteria bacterium]|nr:DUF3501 family protein [Acidobacteriota bacterium]